VRTVRVCVTHPAGNSRPAAGRRPKRLHLQERTQGVQNTDGGGGAAGWHQSTRHRVRPREEQRQLAVGNLVDGLPAKTKVEWC